MIHTDDVVVVLEAALEGWDGKKDAAIGMRERAVATATQHKPMATP